VRVSAGGDRPFEDLLGAWQRQLDRIRSERDPIVRNVLITRSYHDLGRHMRTVLGGQDANWLTFGTWASYTAGRFIRGEGTFVRWGAEEVARGNLAIIDDVAPCFIAYLASAAGEEDSRHPLVLAGRRRMLESPHLADAFACYEEARLCGDDNEDPARAQLILRANIAVAYHEQGLADDFIDRAMPLGGLFGIVTTRFVHLELPEATLDLCRPVPAPAYLDGAMWPSALDAISDPGLVSLYDRIGQAPDDVDGAAARSWEDFDERMGFIAIFFRAFQRDPALHDLPIYSANRAAP
jgi:hypothetical protein